MRGKIQVTREEEVFPGIHNHSMMKQIIVLPYMLAYQMTGW